MLTVFNRKELLVTMELEKQAMVREILSANNIEYTVKTTNLQSSQVVGAHRAMTGNYGINQNYSYEYKIFVGKKDYDKALKLIG